MKSLRLYLAVIAIVLYSAQSFSAVCIATSSGRWEQAGTWSGGVVPNCGDSIVIGVGKNVEISSVLDYTACVTSMKMNISGILSFQNGKKLRLPCNSVVYVNSGALIDGGTGGGNSNLIDICATTVWNTAMGDLSGPVILQLNPLPVKLVDFSARTEGALIVINWVTHSEVNNDFFIVEKSYDGIKFEELGKFDGAGTSSSINSYKVIDILPSIGVQYYRLLQTDFDGRVSTSQVIAVRFTKETECVIYPNPTTGELFVNLNSKKTGSKMQVLINNADGKLLLSKEIQVEHSGYGISLLKSEEFLKSGNYLVTINYDGKSYSNYIVSR